jgi:hypothetical protein
MPDDHKQAPKTVAEIGIHIGYIRQDLQDIKEAIKDSPSRGEFDNVKEDIEELKVQVDKRVTKSEAGVVGTVIGVVIAALSFIFNYLRG